MRGGATLTSRDVVDALPMTGAVPEDSVLRELGGGAAAAAAIDTALILMRVVGFRGARNERWLKRPEPPSSGQRQLALELES